MTSLWSSFSSGMNVRMDCASQLPRWVSLWISLIPSGGPLLHVSLGTWEGQVWRTEQVTVKGSPWIAVFGWISVGSAGSAINEKKAEIKWKTKRCNIKNWYRFMKSYIRSIVNSTQDSTKENLSRVDVSVSFCANSIRKQKGPLSWSLMSVISKVQLLWPRCPNSCVRPLKFSKTVVLSS